ncbi:MAG TPA: hypothetical protein VMZ00_13570 [Sporichthya sp.]|nr:hypothetical protein [Sporichthya sp.]
MRSETMTYTSTKPPLPETSDELRARVPGWGADLDPADRPSGFRREVEDIPTGAHWHFPDRQPEPFARERSIEHVMMPPVFGTSCPPRGLSGAMRKLAYRRWSEARAAHWLTLLAADRVDAVESHLRSLMTLHPDNPITQTGVRSELTHHGLASRRGRGRFDVRHQWMDPVLVAGPWVVAGYAGYRTVRRLTGRG